MTNVIRQAKEKEKKEEKKISTRRLKES